MAFTTPKQLCVERGGGGAMVQATLSVVALVPGTSSRPVCRNPSSATSPPPPPPPPPPPTPKTPPVLSPNIPHRRDGTRGEGTECGHRGDEHGARRTVVRPRKPSQRRAGDGLDLEFTLLPSVNKHEDVIRANAQDYLCGGVSLGCGSERSRAGADGGDRVQAAATRTGVKIQVPSTHKRPEKHQSGHVWFT